MATTINRRGLNIGSLVPLPHSCLVTVTDTYLQKIDRTIPLNQSDYSICDLLLSKVQNCCLATPSNWATMSSAQKRSIEVVTVVAVCLSIGDNCPHFLPEDFHGANMLQVFPTDQQNIRAGFRNVYNDYFGMFLQASTGNLLLYYITCVKCQSIKLILRTQCTLYPSFNHYHHLNFGQSANT